MKNIILKLLKIILLFIPSCIYAFIVKIRNLFYDKNIIKSKTYNIPIICVGNITVGGTGKTPHCEFLINLLKENYKIAVLSRGYKRKTKGFGIVQTGNNFEIYGDEALQIKNKFPEIVVAVCENRCRGVEILLQIVDIDLIILDDGFQHRNLKPSFSIILNNYNRPFSNDFYLPFGKLRDNISSKNRADYFIITKCPENITENEKIKLINNLKPNLNQKVLFSTIVYNDLVGIFDKNNILNLSDLVDYNILLITGIAESNNLFSFLNKNSKTLLHIKYSDHNNFSENEIQNIENKFDKLNDKKILLTTEKDYKKFITFEKYFKQKNKIYFIPIKIKIINEIKDIQILKNHINSYVTKN